MSNKKPARSVRYDQNRGLSLDGQWQDAAQGSHQGLEGAVESVVMVPHCRIDPDPDQIRLDFDEAEIKALRGQIRANRALGKGIGGTGVLQPLTLRLQSGALDEAGKILPSARFFLVDGERRWRATGDDLKTLPAIIRDVSEQEAYDMMVDMALQTKGYGPLEEGLMLVARMNREGWNIRSAAEGLGKPKSWVESRLAAIALPEELMRLVNRKHVSLTNVIEINRVKDAQKRRELALEYEQKSLTKKEVIDRVKELNGKPRKYYPDLTTRVLKDDPRFASARARDVKYPDENYPPGPIPADLRDFGGFVITGAQALGFDDGSGGNVASGGGPVLPISPGVMPSWAPQMEPLRAASNGDFDPCPALEAAYNQLHWLEGQLDTYRGKTPPHDITREVRAGIERIEAALISIEDKLLPGAGQAESEADLASASSA